MKSFYRLARPKRYDSVAAHEVGHALAVSVSHYCGALVGMEVEDGGGLTEYMRTDESEIAEKDLHKWLVDDAIISVAGIAGEIYFGHNPRHPGSTSDMIQFVGSCQRMIVKMPEAKPMPDVPWLVELTPDLIAKLESAQNQLGVLISMRRQMRNFFCSSLASALGRIHRQASFANALMSALSKTHRLDFDDIDIIKIQHWGLE